MLAAKIVMWLQLLLIELSLLLFSNLYIEIKVKERSRDAREIMAYFRDQEEENNKSIASKTTSIDLSISCKAITLKDNK